MGSHKALMNEETFELNRSWNYTVAAGYQTTAQWALEDFENKGYHLRVYGPNGFYREFAGIIKYRQLKYIVVMKKLQK